MRRFTLRSVASSLALLFSAAGLLRGAEEPQPIRVLLITGGCCHDYAVQKDLLKKGLEARAHVVVDQVHTDDKSTKPPLAIFGNPDYANGYNVVVHDECAAALADPAIIRQVLAPHRAGIPGVNLHCAVHSYRIGDQKVPAEAGSERAMWFDYLGIQSSQHGPKLPIPVTTLNDKHPIIAGLNWREWTTVDEELYNNVVLRQTATPLQRGTQELKQKEGAAKQAEAVVTWVNDYDGTRVFNTTLGHFNETVADARYLDLVTRGLLWACGKLNDKYLKPGDHPSLAVPAAAPAAAPAGKNQRQKNAGKEAATGADSGAGCCGDPEPAALPAAAEGARPNILLIVGDDMGFADVGFHGCKDIPTPHLDALAASGARFTNGYVTGPYCSPTRAGLLTGRYQQRFGHEFNPGGGTSGMPVTEKTIADRLKAAGYRTGLVGKWHLGTQETMHPQRRGFDEFFGFLGGAHSFFDAAGIMRGTEPVKSMDYTTDAFGREAASFIEKHQGEPWFLYLAFNAVHTPMHATDDRLAKFPQVEDKQRRTYDAMMLAMDEAIGVVMKKLAQTGQEKNTLVAFISDNGGPTMPGVTVNGSVNTPLRGSKRTTLEGGIRVPFVVSWPGRVKPGTVDMPVIQLDLTATALAVAGVAADAKIEGVNLLPYLDGTRTGTPHDALYWRFGQQMAIRAGDFKLVRYDTNADTLTGARNQPVTGVRLYNLAKDIGETNDLAAAMPEKVKELQAKWDKWNESNVAPLWGGGKSDSDGAEPGKPAAKKKKKGAKAP
jgi:arylsulfatase A-like enzyme